MKYARLFRFLGTVVPIALLGLLFVLVASASVQVWLQPPKSVEAHYSVQVVTGNYSAGDLQLRLVLFPHLNGSLLGVCSDGARLVPGSAYVDITFSEISPHSLGYCEFAVSAGPPVPSRYEILNPERIVVGAVNLDNDVKVYQLDKIIVIVSVVQSVGFSSFLTETEAQVIHQSGWYRYLIRYGTVRDFGIMLLTMAVTLGILLCAQILKMFRETCRFAEIVSDDFPCLTLSLFWITTMVYVYLGLVSEWSISKVIVGGFTSNSWVNFAVNGPVNTFFHLDSSHFDGNMLSLMPWDGLPLGVLPVGIILESILKVRRRLILAVYFLTPYLAIVGIRYGSPFGFGASLSLFGLTALSIVASYNAIYSRPSSRKALKIVQFAVVLFVGYAITVYVGGYLFPLSLLRLTGRVSYGPWGQADVPAHILSAVVPMLLLALYARRDFRKLFR